VLPVRLTLVLLLAARSTAQAEEATCRESVACTRHGRCMGENGVCVARSQADCAASTVCREHGLRCELDSEAARCGESPEDRERLSHDPPPDPQDGRRVALALGVVSTVLGLGAAIALPLMWAELPRDERLSAAIGLPVASLTGFVGGIGLVVYGASTPFDGRPSQWSALSPAPARGAALTWRVSF
jgi:hypothetical protein